MKRKFHFKYSPIELSVTGIIAANMDTTGTFAMAHSMRDLGCMTALHKFYTLEQLEEFIYSKETDVASYTFITTGIRQQDQDKLFSLPEECHPSLICIDVPNAYYAGVVDFCSKVRQHFPMSVIMAGNVCTPEMTQELVINGKVDIVKIGIGPGSVCTTRMMTGVGYPQFSAVAECADVAHGLKAHICCDGGCKEPGDVSKAFGAGADFVMLGGLLAGSEDLLRGDDGWFRGYVQQELGHYVAEAVVDALVGLENA